MYTQMVWLFKDPEGTQVFADHEAAMQAAMVTTMLSGKENQTQDNDEGSSLRRRVRELENALEEYKVQPI